MVMSSDRRIAKYGAKIVGDVIKNRIDAQKDAMTANFTSAANAVVEKETAIKTICETAGVSSIQVPFYMSYGRELWGITLRHLGAIRTNEAQLAYDKWVAATRGLTSAVLIEIASGVFGITVA